MKEEQLTQQAINAEPLIARAGMVLTSRIDDYPGGIIVPIDKPLRWTSADVIRKVKFTAIRHFGKKNLKVGHAGTLDPLATGVLLVCIGNATKLAEALQRHDKEYVAGITFGATTPSYDLEKDIDRRFPVSGVNAESVAGALKGFIGEQDQVAPLFSAKSVDGVRAYELARKLYRQQSESGSGADASTFDEAASVLRVSRINISETELISFSDSAMNGSSPEGMTELGSEGENRKNARINMAEDDPGLPHATVRIACSKGTYVRAFARDLGEALGTGAFLNRLQRSRSGMFKVSDALTVDEALDMLKCSFSHSC